MADSFTERFSAEKIARQLRFSAAGGKRGRSATAGQERRSQFGLAERISPVDTNFFSILNT